MRLLFQRYVEKKPSKRGFWGFEDGIPKTLKAETVEYETILDEKEVAELNENEQFEPPDLADQAYEVWREENRSKEGQAE
jgi:hypothetical protein